MEQAGTVRIVVPGATLLTAPFLDIHTRVSCCGEQGLLGLAFPPDYAARGYFYVNYTDLNGDTVVARFSVTADPNRANENSQVILLTIDQPYANHNGGQLAFGPDGFLYIGMGDGGSGGDPQNHAQNPDDLLGKILRIDTEGAGCVTNPPATPRNYCIPANNPFMDDPTYRPEIWALGLRNPWRFSFDSANGDLYIGDVGQDLVEEINFQPASSSGGDNYGWRILEGDRCNNPGSGCTPPANYAAPVATYPHGQNDSNGCSVTGGYVYRGSLFPGMAGVYLYGDLCTGKIYGLRQAGAVWETSHLVTAPFTISTFGEDQTGNLYVAGYNTGALYRIQSTIDPAQFPYSNYFPHMEK